MHRKIVEQIKGVIENCPFAKHCDIFVKSNETAGFWEMVIIVEYWNHESYIPHVESAARAIGLMYGEDLLFKRERNLLRVG
jgi:hypothetical protein